MISIWSIADAGKFLRRFARSVGDKNVGLPSIITITPAFPRKLMAPSLLTIMPGDFSNTSNAVAPALVGDASTFTTVLSILVSMNGRLAVTVTSLSPFAAGTSCNVSTCALFAAELITIFLLPALSKPTVVACII